MRTKVVLALALIFTFGCASSGSGKSGEEVLATGDTVDSSAPDSRVGETTEHDVTSSDLQVGDLKPDTGSTVALEVPILGPLSEPPDHLILPAGVEACSLIREERCVEGKLQGCELFDGESESWAVKVPPMTEQAYMFDRYYDLYHEVEGQTMDTHFAKIVPYGTPESEWSKPEYFERYDGYGDASGWTGTAVWAAAARYRATGTTADYERMLTKLEKAVFLYEVTNVPGLIARSHGAMLPEGAPLPHGNWGKAIRGYNSCDGTAGHFCYPVEAELAERIPEYYTTGVEIGEVHYDTAPTWQGDASRDMYVRGLPGLMLAYDLLEEGSREEQVKSTMRLELSCTLNRMKRGRIYNLDKNVEVKEILQGYLAGPNMLLEEGEEAVFTEADELVFFAMEQPHPLHWDLFDRACPDGPPMEVDPAFELDAEDPMFLLNLLALFAKEGGMGDQPLAWTQHPAVRGADTVFMTSWALTAHYLTGDERYLEFLQDLMETVPYDQVVHTYGALQLPKWCAPHFAPSLVYPSLYHLLARIDPEAFPNYWAMLSSAVVSEGKGKDIANRDDCLFGILYERMTDMSTDPERGDYVSHHAEVLATYGMSAENKLEPDRNVPRNFIDTPDPTVPLEEIPANELALCTEPPEVMGISFPAPGLEDDWPRAADPVPLPKRVGGAFLWQMDPWMVKREYGGTGMDRQWPMLGMTTPYWVGRMDGVISEGEGLALGWRDLDGPCP
jgi:hypothetical protein